MEQANNNDYDPSRMRQLLSGVPFFNEVSRDNANEFALLEERTRLWVAQPEETVIRAGDVDSTLYFLLRGQLEVLADREDQPPLYYVSPGEAFGTLSMLLGTPRSATIRVAENAREAVLASLDFTAFQGDDSPYSLSTRLAFYRMIVHHIRWTLEVKRMEDPSNELVAEMRKVPMFTGAKGSDEELSALCMQAQCLADLLCRWNDSNQAAAAGALQLT